MFKWERNALNKKKSLICKCMYIKTKFLTVILSNDLKKFLRRIYYTNKDDMKGKAKFILQTNSLSLES